MGHALAECIICGRGTALGIDDAGGFDPVPLGLGCTAPGEIAVDDQLRGVADGGPRRLELESDAALEPKPRPMARNLKVLCDRLTVHAVSWVELATTVRRK